jgi:hypothetical protein
MDRLNLSELLTRLPTYRVVIVTGPQRSGTTIATQILAAELRFTPVLEESFREDNLMAFASIVVKRRKAVIQAPALSSIVHLLSAVDVAVVFMWRRVEDIIRSEERIDWTKSFERVEKEKYFLPDDPRPVSEIKQTIWREQQRPRLGARAFELDYESMSNHPLWIEKSSRVNFLPRQTKATLPVAEEDNALAQPKRRIKKVFNSLVKAVFGSDTAL